MSEGSPAWHQALAYLLTGRRYPELGRQDQPDLAVLAAFLRSRPEDEQQPSAPVSLPPDLAPGLGPAQLAAAAQELRRRLGSDTARTAGVRQDRPLTADEQRLLRDVPPHHG